MFVECSARDGRNTEYIFVQAAKLLYTDYIKYKIGNPLIGKKSGNNSGGGNNNGKTKLKKENEKKEIIRTNTEIIDMKCKTTETLKKQFNKIQEETNEQRTVIDELKDKILVLEEKIKKKKIIITP